MGLTPGVEWNTTGLIEIDFEAIADGLNDDVVIRLGNSGGVFWPAVPRVGDLISFEDGSTATVKRVFWDYPEGTVMVTVR